MTHDELLARLDSLDDYYSFDLMPALRAVVTRHKPKTDRDGYGICVECTERSYFSVPYPCPTILDIEEELK